ncbi:MAG: acyl carrier protein [Phycisphaerae bacterium]|nr:acyl carrier protein [Phycisphaerae bacterium]
MNELNERLIRCFSIVFPDLPADQIPRASVSAVAQWDSLATLNLVGVLEEEFQIRFGADDLPSLLSFELIRDRLSERVYAPNA